MGLRLSEQRFLHSRRWREVVDLCEIVDPDENQDVLVMVKGYARREIAYDLGALLREIYIYEVGEPVPKDHDAIVRTLLDSMRS